MLLENDFSRKIMTRRPSTYPTSFLFIRLLKLAVLCRYTT